MLSQILVGVECNSKVLSANVFGYKPADRFLSEMVMPKLTVENVGTFEIPDGKRLVNALVDEAKVDQMHACGGYAKCTTCRVEFVAGEPKKIAAAEREVLSSRGLLGQAGLRLSCQILVDQDMTVRVISRVGERGKAGDRPVDQMTPPPVWTEK
jgi:ferredoxin